MHSLSCDWIGSAWAAPDLASLVEEESRHCLSSPHWARNCFSRSRARWVAALLSTARFHEFSIDGVAFRLGLFYRRCRVRLGLSRVSICGFHIPNRHPKTGLVGYLHSARINADPSLPRGGYSWAFLFRNGHFLADLKLIAAMKAEKIIDFVGAYHRAAVGIARFRPQHQILQNVGILRGSAPPNRT